MGFLGVAAVITMHKTVYIAERARQKPDKAAREVGYDVPTAVLVIESYAYATRRCAQPNR